MLTYGKLQCFQLVTDSLHFKSDRLLAQRYRTHAERLNQRDGGSLSQNESSSRAPYRTTTLPRAVRVDHPSSAACTPTTCLVHRLTRPASLLQSPCGLVDGLPPLLARNLSERDFATKPLHKMTSGSSSHSRSKLSASGRISRYCRRYGRGCGAVDLFRCLLPDNCSLHHVMGKSAPSMRSSFF